MPATHLNEYLNKRLQETVPETQTDSLRAIQRATCQKNIDY